MISPEQLTFIIFVSFMLNNCLSQRNLSITVTNNYVGATNSSYIFQITNRTKEIPESGDIVLSFSPSYRLSNTLGILPIYGLSQNTLININLNINSIVLSNGYPYNISMLKFAIVPTKNSDGIFVTSNKTGSIQVYSALNSIKLENIGTRHVFILPDINTNIVFYPSPEIFPQNKTLTVQVTTKNLIPKYSGIVLIFPLIYENSTNDNIFFINSPRVCDGLQNTRKRLNCQINNQTITIPNFNQENLQPSSTIKFLLGDFIDPPSFAPFQGIQFYLVDSSGGYIEGTDLASLQFETSNEINRVFAKLHNINGMQNTYVLEIVIYPNQLFLSNISIKFTFEEGSLISFANFIKNNCSNVTRTYNSLTINDIPINNSPKEVIKIDLNNITVNTSILNVRIEVYDGDYYLTLWKNLTIQVPCSSVIESNHNLITIHNLTSLISFNSNGNSRDMAIHFGYDRYANIELKIILEIIISIDINFDYICESDTIASVYCVLRQISDIKTLTIFNGLKNLGFNNTVKFTFKNLFPEVIPEGKFQVTIADSLGTQIYQSPYMELVYDNSNNATNKLKNNVSMIFGEQQKWIVGTMLSTTLRIDSNLNTCARSNCILEIAFSKDFDLSNTTTVPLDLNTSATIDFLSNKIRYIDISNFPFIVKLNNILNPMEENVWIINATVIDFIDKYTTSTSIETLSNQSFCLDNKTSQNNDIEVVASRNDFRLLNDKINLTQIDCFENHPLLYNDFQEKLDSAYSLMILITFGLGISMSIISYRFFKIRNKLIFILLIFSISEYVSIISLGRVLVTNSASLRFITIFFICAYGFAAILTITICAFYGENTRSYYLKLIIALILNMKLLLVLNLNRKGMKDEIENHSKGYSISAKLLFYVINWIKVGFCSICLFIFMKVYNLENQISHYYISFALYFAINCLLCFIFGP